MIEGLVGILLLLFVWALIGHGLWLLGAAVWRALSGNSGNTLPAARPSRCPRCAEALESGRAYCRQCGLRLPLAGASELADEADELNRVAGRLRLWFRAERISSEQHQELQALVRADRAALREQQSQVREGEAKRRLGPVAPESPIPSGQQREGILPESQRSDVSEKAVREQPAERKPSGRRAEPASQSTQLPEAARPLRDPERQQTSARQPRRPQKEARPPKPSVSSVGLPEAAVPAERRTEPRTEPRTLSALMAAFMEERNIRWGELISGLLIVGSAIGLVISLWSTLDDIPYFPGLLFLLVTAGLHAAGRYTLSRWKLESTSRGLLVISTLLIPLNFLAAIALSENDPSINLPMYVAAVLVGAVSFSIISVSASRILMISDPWLLVGGVMGPCLSQLVFSRLVAPDLSQTAVFALACLPVFLYLAVIGGYVWRTGYWSHWTLRRTNQTFILLGVSLFSLTLCLALLFLKTRQLSETASTISPLLSLVAVAVVAVGTVIHRRLTETELHGQRMAGTAISLLGASLMATAVLLAWPQPALLIAVASINFVALTVFALVSGIHPLHVPALGSVAVAVDLTVLLLTNRLDPDANSLEVVRAATSGLSSGILTATGFVVAAVSAAVRRLNRLDMSHQYDRAAALLSLGAVLTAVYAGFVTRVDPLWATPVLALNGFAGLLIALRLRHQLVTWFASGVLLLASVHGLTQNADYRTFLETFGLVPAYPLAAALLSHATLAAVAAVLIGAFARKRKTLETEAAPARQIRSSILDPLCVSAVVTSAAALPQSLFVQQQQFAIHSLYTIWCVAVWMVAAYVLEAKPLFLASRCLASIGIALATTAACRGMSWWSGSYDDPRHLHWQLSAVALTGVFWELLRRLAETKTAPVSADEARTEQRAVADASSVLAFRNRWAGLFDSEHVFERTLISLATGGVCLITLCGNAPLLISESSLMDRYLRSAGTFQPAMLSMLFVTLAGAVVSQVQVSRVQMSRSGWFGIAAALAGLFLVLGPLDEMCSVWKLDDSLRAMCYGATAWIALGSCLAGLAIQHRWLRTVPNAGVLAAAILVVPFLIAPLFPASDDALRWLLADYAAAAGLLLIAIQIVSGPGDQSRWAFDGLRRPIQMVLVVLSVLLMGLAGRGIIDAVPELAERSAETLSLWSVWTFRNASLCGALTLFAVTLAAVALVLRIREATAAVAWVSQLVLFSTLALQLSPALSGTNADGVWLALFQRIALAAACGGVIWHLGQKWLDRCEPETGSAYRLSATLTAENGLPTLQHCVAALGCGIACLAGFLAIVDIPTAPRADLLVCGSLVGFITLIATSGIWLSACRWLSGAAFAHVTGFTLVALVIQVAAGSANMEVADPWFSFHVLEGGFLLTALASVAALVLFRQRQHAADERWFGFRVSSLGPATYVWSLALLALASALALAGFLNDPLGRVWSVSILGGVTVLIVVLALLRTSAALAAISVIAASLTMLLRQSAHLLDLKSPQLQDLVNAAFALGCVTVSMSLFWLVVEIWYQRRLGSRFHPQRLPRTHMVFGCGVLVIAAINLSWLLAQRVAGYDAAVTFQTPGAWCLLLLLTALFAGRLWERGARFRIESIWCTSCVWLAFILELTGHQRTDLWTALTWAIAVHGVLLALCVAGRKPILRQLTRYGSALTGEEAGVSRIGVLAAQVTLAVAAQFIGFHGVTDFAVSAQRVSVSLAATSGVVGLLILAHTLAPSRLQCVSLILLATGGTEIGWALLEISGVAHLPLLRSLRTMEVMGLFAAVYGVILVRIAAAGSEWRRAIHQAAVILGALTLVSLLAVLIGEYRWFSPATGAPLSGPQIGITAFVLVGLCASLISLAVLPDRDPLQLSERGRRAYVYAAEVILGLLFLHLYLTVPELFTGRLRRYWPFIVMAIAFTGVAVGEWMSRLRLRVLAEPLQRTAAFLPLIPILSLWIAGNHGSLSLTLFLCGGLYLTLSMLRKSFEFGLGAGLAANAALWVMLHDHGLSLLTRPQMWLIPPSLSVLIAAHFNRERIGETQLTSIRYLAVTMIYVSSSGEMFVNGVGRSLWLPMILAGLSVAGVFAGILLRIRAFLYLGSSFLLLSIVSMVWHAAQRLDHVWPWWAFGVVLGLVILTIFGLFERRRNEMLTVVSELRQWER